MTRWRDGRKGALEWVHGHPALPRNAEAYDNVNLREAAIAKFEARWLRAWKDSEPKGMALEVVAW
jgi:hypothetical protein